MIKLCKFCKEVYGTGEIADECEVCRGYSRNAEKVLEEIKKLEKEKGWKVETKMPKEWMKNEEKIFDLKLCNSAKTYINKKIKEILKGGNEWVIKVDIEKGELKVEKAKVFIFGRYMKLKPGISQHKWPCRKGDEEKFERCKRSKYRYPSIEEIIENALKGIGKKIKFHASGREDVDATNTAGRAFVIEFLPEADEIDVKLIEKKINENDLGVKVKDLKIVERKWVELVSDSHFDKVYEAKLNISLTEEEKEKIERFRGKIMQRTPRRVEKRRPDIVRERSIYYVKVLSLEPGIIEVFAEAGTYIKEFVSGDEGRTYPSISAIIGREARVVHLNVKRIYDEFFEMIE